MTNPAKPRAYDHLRALRALPEMGEHEINGQVWTRYKSMGEYKVSPHGGAGDFDTWYVTDRDLSLVVRDVLDDYDYD